MIENVEDSVFINGLPNERPTGLVPNEVLQLDACVSHSTGVSTLFNELPIRRAVANSEKFVHADVVEFGNHARRLSLGDALSGDNAETPWQGNGVSAPTDCCPITESLQERVDSSHVFIVLNDRHDFRHVLALKLVEK